MVLVILLCTGFLGNYWAFYMKLNLFLFPFFQVLYCETDFGFSVFMEMLNVRKIPEPLKVQQKNTFKKAPWQRLFTESMTLFSRSSFTVITTSYEPPKHKPSVELIHRLKMLQNTQKSVHHISVVVPGEIRNILP